MKLQQCARLCIILSNGQFVCLAQKTHEMGPKTANLL
jgi:hypothetical protein